jgi:hypothetical protein
MGHHRSWSRRARSSTLALVVVAVGAALALPASAHNPSLPYYGDGAIDNALATHHHDIQHDGDDGHLPASNANVELVGRGQINQDLPGRVSDVGVFGNYAYLGAFFEPDCQKGGVYVFDISDLSAPKQINFIRGEQDTWTGEGVQVIHIDTPAFEGDVLVQGHETCLNNAGNTSQHAAGGWTLVDVSNPKTHRYLVRGFGDFDNTDGSVSARAHESHSQFLWDAGDHAYLVGVDNEEGPDVDIFDISDPTQPVKIAEYDLNTAFGGIIPDAVLGTGESFHHDVIVKEIDGRQIMSVSYWDGGYVLLDVTDPANATYIGDTDFPAVDPMLFERTGDSRVPEGNAHQSEISLDNQLLIAADEDFNPFKTAATNVDDGTAFTASSGSDTPPLEPGQLIEGATVFVGRACPGDPAPPPAPGTGNIAVVERGVCTFTEKVAAVEAAGGYEAIIVMNRTGSDACEAALGMLVEGNTPTFGVVPRSVGFALFDTPYDEAACLADTGGGQAPIALGTVGDTVRLESYFDGWGYVHAYEMGTGKLTELDTYAIPEAHDRDFAEGFGDLSVHEVAMSHQIANRGYLSYYSGGFRVIAVEGGEIVEKGHFIDEGGNNLWGVQVFERDGVEYVAASDRDFGLYIFRYTGP